MLLLARGVISPGSVRPFLNPTKVLHVVQLLQDGTSTRAVTGRLNVSPSRISRIWRRLAEGIQRAVEGP